MPPADRFCGMTSGTLVDTYVPPVGLVVYYLVSGEGAAGEGDLGTDGAGVPRPNHNPCP